jgi:RNA polymerase sigma-70 factor (ECF subfamily)
VIPDTELMFATRGGDLDAVGALFERHHAAVYAYCARVTLDRSAAADLVQETFLRVFRYRSGFTGGGFAGWLFRIARNVCFDHLRGEHRRAELEEMWSREREGALPAASARARLLEIGLSRLPADDREVISLSRFQDLPYEEVAEALGCSPGAARVRLHRALKRLRGILDELEGDDELRDPSVANR